MQKALRESHHNLPEGDPAAVANFPDLSRIHGHRYKWTLDFNFSGNYYYFFLKFQ